MDNQNNNQNINSNVVPNVASPNAAVKTTPMPATPQQNYNPVNTPATPAQSSATPMNTQPSTPQPTVQTPPQSTVTPPVPNFNNSNEVSVINTTKKKTSNVILIIFLLLLIVFVYKIDVVIKYYENYVKTGSLKGDTETTDTDNLVNGYILINDSTGSMKMESINFYNFRKVENTTLSFNYLSSVDYTNSSSLKLYVEIYNSEKELLYKEQFNTVGNIEKDSVRIYSINIDNYVYTYGYYALIKKYTEETNTTSSLTCSLDNEDVSYKVIYNFSNDLLINYTVNKELKNNNKKLELDKEYKSVVNYFNPTYNNNKLSYSVDLNNYNNEFNPLYLKGTTPKVVTAKEELKKWTCKNG